MKKKGIKHANASGLLFLVVGFIMTGFVMLAFAGGAFDVFAILFGAALSFIMLAAYWIFLWISKHIDRFIIIVADLLSGIGMMVQYRINPELAFRQVAMLLIGIAAMMVCMLFMRRPEIFRKLSWPLMLISLGILGALLFLGKEAGGAKNWIIIAGIRFQPSEFVKVALVLVLSHWLTDRRLLRELIVPLAFAALCVLMLVIQRDLGAAVLFLSTALILFYTATGRAVPTLIGLGAGCVGAVGSYYVFDHVKARVAVWLNPWATYDTSGYQIAQGLMAIATGGMWGVGLGLGSPKLIPAYSTDYIFAVICEEFGILFGICVIALYLVFIIRGAIIALNAHDRFSMLVAFGCTAILTLQSFIIIGGVIKMIPLTGITLPFVSQGGSSLIACMMLSGLMEGAAVKSGDILEKRMVQMQDEHEA